MKYEINVTSKIKYINAATGPYLWYWINDVKEPNININNEVGIDVIKAPGWTWLNFNLKLGEYK